MTHTMHLLGGLYLTPIFHRSILGSIRVPAPRSRRSCLGCLSFIPSEDPEVLYWYLNELFFGVASAVQTYH